ncbi:MAG: xanthine dehydrogenase family protein subunit M [Bacteroidales bacterium]
MPISHEFQYCKPANLDEVLKTLAEYGNSAYILAGGTDLVVKIKEGMEEPQIVIDIKGIEALKKIEQKGNMLHIGASVTFTDLINSEIIKTKLPLIWEASKTVASVGIRNRATIVGNICSAVPSLDSGPALLNYEAIVCLKSSKGERNTPISQWFIGPKKTTRNVDEMVTEIIVPIPHEKHAVYYGKLGRYSGEDLAQAGIGIIGFANKKYHISFCAVGPVPERSEKLEALLNGKEVNNKLIEKAKKMIEEEISPITDIRATKEYRMHIIKVMFERGLKKVNENLKNN